MRAIEVMRSIYVGVLSLILSAFFSLEASAQAGFQAPSVTPKAGPETFRIATWNIEHLGVSGESCLDRNAADFHALRVYAKQLDADVIAIQEIASLRAAQAVFPEDEYVVVLDQRPYRGDRPLCWGFHSQVVSPTPLLGNAYTGFAVKRTVPLEIHQPYKALGNLERASGSNAYGTDITVSVFGRALRLMSVHLKKGCTTVEEFYSPECDYVSKQAKAIRDWVGLRRSEGVSFGILGDFNREWSRASPYWRAAFNLESKPAAVEASAEAMFSECVFTPSFIDHIFLFRSQSSAEVKFGQMSYVRYDRDNFKISDHCPVIADISAPS